MSQASAFPSLAVHLVNQSCRQVAVCLAHVHCERLRFKSVKQCGDVANPAVRQAFGPLQAMQVLELQAGRDQFIDISNSLYFSSIILTIICNGRNLSMIFCHDDL